MKIIIYRNNKKKILYFILINYPTSDLNIFLFLGSRSIS